MTTPIKLESYLARLDYSLGQIPVSEKSDIITEIKSHILDAQKRDPNKGLDEIFDALGTPEQVAERYLQEKGLQAVSRRQPGNFMKWLVIGFLGTLALFLLFIIIMAWKFTPLIQVDETQGTVKLMGGLINVQEDLLDKDDDDKEVDNSKMNWGYFDVDPKKSPNLKLEFNNGKLTFETSDKNIIRYKCKGIDHRKLETIKNQETNRINLSSSPMVKCQFQIPAPIKLSVNGGNGSLSFERPHFPIDVHLGNGKVNINPDNAMKYKYELNVTNGKTDAFQSSNDKNALQISVDVGNGIIRKK